MGTGAVGGGALAVREGPDESEDMRCVSVNKMLVGMRVHKEQ